MFRKEVGVRSCEVRKRQREMVPLLVQHCAALGHSQNLSDPWLLYVYLEVSRIPTSQDVVRIKWDSHGKGLTQYWARGNP